EPAGAVDRERDVGDLAAARDELVDPRRVEQSREGLPGAADVGGEHEPVVRRLDRGIGEDDVEHAAVTGEVHAARELEGVVRATQGDALAVAVLDALVLLPGIRERLQVVAEARLDAPLELHSRTVGHGLTPFRMTDRFVTCLTNIRLSGAAPKVE